MNRTLRRPMFRIGGSAAEGITSGLDHPQPTASRTRYENGNIVLERTKESFPEYQKALQSVRPERRPYWPQFATSFGLDLLTRPKSGNIFQQLAASAKGPYDKWMEHRAGREGVDDKLASALFGDVMDIETRKYEAEKEVEAEAAGKTDKQFDPGAAAKIDNLRKDSYNEKLRLENELAELKAKQNPSEEDTIRIQQIEKAELPAVEGTINDLEGAETTLQKIAQAGMQERFNDTVDELMESTNPKTDENYTMEEAFQEALRIFGSMFEAKADGGRVGYQMGGDVMPGQPMQASMPMNQGPRPTDQGQDDSVQDLSFEELRARLPQEITNDIIQLIVSSKQALVEFANIRTQQDVNAFNQKYDVNLVVPQEA
mgnify:FL=1